MWRRWVYRWLVVSLAVLVLPGWPLVVRAAADVPVLPPLVDGALRWSFDVDLGGVAEVSTGAGGVNVNVNARGNVPLVPGRVGYAAHFSGGSGLFLGADIIAGDTFSVAFWANPSEVTDWSSLFFAGGVQRHLSIAGRIGWARGTGAISTVPGVRLYSFGSGVIPAGEWTHVAFVSDGALSRLYLNGRRTYTHVNPPDIFTGFAGSQFFLGINTFPDVPFRGLIDELYIYPTQALSTAEIKAKALLEIPVHIMPGANVGYVDPPAPVFANITVHDPSLTRARVDGYFYVIGTFLGGGRSRDLMQWESINYGRGPIRPNNTSGHYFFPVDNPDPAVETMARQIERVDAANTPDGGINFWANEIIQMPCGRFFMYYSLSAGFHAGVAQANRSGIGLAIAYDIRGPWVTQGLIVGSGRTNDGFDRGWNWGASQDGTVAFNTMLHTNAIDPSPFFDSRGNFWLVYGSWSGGIFIFEMCADTGLPLEDSEINARNHGYGEQVIALSGAPSGGVEGAHILFSQQSGYYYLFVTTGGLSADDGYNVRIFRSLYPQGPFVDTRFQQINTRHLPAMNVRDNFVDADGYRFNFEQLGVKILGGYHFVGTEAEVHMGTGYLSPGHGGAILCPDSGRYYKVFHTRWVGRGEWHAIRVHEMFMTEAGWFAIAPLRFDGGEGARAFDPAALVGDFKVLHHGRYVYHEAQQSVVYRFNSNGMITDADNYIVGRWYVRDGNVADIVLHNLNYNGVFLRQFDENQQTWVQTFTAISHSNGHDDNGLAIWGVGVSVGEAYDAMVLVLPAFSAVPTPEPTPRPTATIIPRPEHTPAPTPAPDVPGVDLPAEEVTAGEGEGENGSRLPGIVNLIMLGAIILTPVGVFFAVKKRKN